MERILITNSTYFNKEYFQTFAKQKEYKFFSVNKGSSTLVPLYQELLREVIGNDADTVFRDRELTTIETQQIKSIFEREIDKILPEIEPFGKRRYKQWTLNWKGKSYDMCLNLVSPIGSRIRDYYDIIQICEKCLEENKSMYLSIE